MQADRNDDLTKLLARLNQGDDKVLGELMDRVYQDLRAMARRQFDRRFGPRHGGVTLQPTALVNETFIRLVKQRQQFDNRGHFFAIATKLMIRILLDYDRRRRAAKRGGVACRALLDPDRLPADAVSDEDGATLPDLVAALDRLGELDARKAEVVKLRVFWGLTVAEAAETLGVSRPTVDRDWQFARAWLRKALTEDAG